MLDFPDDLISLLFQVIPGFLTAWVLYGLTAYRRPGPFERIVQALIFTVLVQLLTNLSGWMLIGIGQYAFTIGDWTENFSRGWSFVTALLLGVALAYAANTGAVHDWFWRRGITNGNSLPSVWYWSFAKEKRWVILHLKNDTRRLFGWPRDWPDHPDSDYFALSDVEWLLSDGGREPLEGVDRLLVPVEIVAMVELLKDESEVSTADVQLKG